MSRRRTSISLGLATTLLVACATSPEPTPEDTRAEALGHVQIPQTWSAPADAAPVEAGWLAAFNDPQLDALIAQALAHNPDLAMAAARVEQANAQVDLAAAQLQPAIGILGRGGSNSVSDLVSTLNGGMLRLTWEVDLWGRLRYQRNAAIAQRDASNADYRFARQSLAASVARAWFVAAETAQQVQLANQMAADAERLVSLSNDRLRVGIGTEADVMTARASHATYRDAAQRVGLAHRSALRALEILIGSYPAAAITPRAELSPFPPGIPAGMPLDALDRRPDMIAAQRRVAAAFDLVGEAKASFWPSLSLSAGYGHISREAIDIQKSFERTTSSASAAAVVPLYTGGSLSGNVRLRGAEQREAVANYARLSLQALGEVETALDAENSLAEREELLSIAAQDNRRVAGLAQESYRIGKADLREVMQRRLSADAAQIALLAVRRERLVRRVDLHLALGGDFLVTPEP